MSKITIEEVKHVAHLARLEMNDEETIKFQGELEELLVMIDELNELDTANIEPTTHVIHIHNVLREDKPTRGLEQTSVLKNAPSHLDGQIKVPAIME